MDVRALAVRWGGSAGNGGQMGWMYGHWRSGEVDVRSLAVRWDGCAGTGGQVGWMYGHWRAG